MNEVRPEGHTIELGIKCLLLDGKDWTIRNLFLKDTQTAIRPYPYASNITQIFQNLNILNCYYTYLNILGDNYPAGFVQVFNENYGGTQFKFINCKFSVLINQNESPSNSFIGNQRSTSWTTLYFDTCSFNIKFFNACDNFLYSNGDNGIYLSYCNFKIRFCKNCTVLLGNEATKVNNCKFKIIGSNDKATSYIERVNADANSQFNSCYFYLDIFLKYATSYSGAFRSTCIFNKDTRQENFYSQVSNIKNLTTEEILQPELLESYGFPIMIEDDGT